MPRKGIILAGGSGTRLGDCTKAISKHLLPIYDKPMIYYPLSTLIACGIKDVLLITNPENIFQYEKLLSNGQQFNINIQYAEQDKPRGISEAFIIGESFLGGSASALILGDNIFYGSDLQVLCNINDYNKSCLITAYKVFNPKSYGVVILEHDGLCHSLQEVYSVKHIEEKPLHPLSDLAVPGLYFLPGDASARAKDIRPSSRQELEITSLIDSYIKDNNCYAFRLLDQSFWFDAGTHDGLLEVSQFVAATEKRRGCKIGCPYTSSEQLANQ